jgi:hypothetical protein
MQPTVSIDRQQLNAFEKTIRDTVAQSKKSISGAMIQASVFASVSAAGSVYGRTASDKKWRQFGAKNRKFQKLKREKAPRDKKGRLIKQTNGKRPWWAVGRVEVWSKGVKKDAYFRTAAAFQKAKPVPRRGLAGNVWRAAGAVKAAGIAGVFQRSLTMGKEARLTGAYASNSIQKTNGMISRVSMSNSLRYIQKVAPNSAREGVAYANKRMRGILDKKIARDIERAFQRRQRG